VGAPPRANALSSYRADAATVSGTDGAFLNGANGVPNRTASPLDGCRFSLESHGGRSLGASYRPYEGGHVQVVVSSPEAVRHDVALVAPASQAQVVDTPAPGAGRTYAMLAVVTLSLQVLQILPQLFANPGPPQWNRLILVALNMVPNFPGAVWVWYYTSARVETRQRLVRTLAYHALGCLLLVCSAAVCGLSLRTLVQGSDYALQTAGMGRYWVSLVASTPIWYTLFYFIARFSREQQRRWEAMRLAEQRERARHRAEALRSATELRMLQLYTQPHFLFNALNTIASLIDLAPARARSAIVMTSALLRATLADSRESDDLVPLRDELAIARQYLQVEQLRMDERLQYLEDISVRTLTVPVPRFLVQTLVENAVRHGLFPHPAGGTVTITSRIEHERLLVSVVDSGVGAEPSAVAISSGFGIRSLRDRLRLMYGDQATFDIDTAPAAGFRATVTVPTTPPGEALT
jgi:two-component sensor histidine kinase